MQSAHSIEVTNVNKIYRGIKRSIHALKGVSLNIPDGAVFGLLGPNGAGKTTLLKLMLGILSPTSGSIAVFGENVRHASGRSNFGYLPENHKFPGYMSGVNALHVFAGMSGMTRTERDKKIPEWLERVGLSMADGKMAMKKYSKGMQQRLGLAQALIHNPRVIFLDEPTDGVDPKGRYEIRLVLEEQKKLGKTIFINSHLLSEVELICDRVAIMKAGELAWQGTLPEIQSTHHIYRFVVEPSLIEEARNILDNAFHSARINEEGIDVEMLEKSGVSKAIDLLRADGIPIYEIRFHKRTLEEFFIEVITNGGGR